MKLEIHLFAFLKEIAKAPIIELSLKEGATSGDLVEALVNRFPELSGTEGKLLVAIDGECSSEEDIIDPLSGEIAIYPPVSGG